MITIVDRNEKFVVQKVTRPNGDILRYQVVPHDRAGDSLAITVASSLAMARQFIGKGPNGKPLTA